MTLSEDMVALRVEVKDLAGKLAENTTQTNTHEEQISGKRGILVAIESLTEEFRSLKRAVWAGAISFVVGSGLIAVGVMRAAGQL